LFFDGPFANCLGDEWQPVTQKNKDDGATRSAGAPAVILYKQVDRNDLVFNVARRGRIQLCPNQNLHGRRTQVRQCRDPFSEATKLNQRDKARTIRPDGTITNFDGKVYEEMVERRRVRNIWRRNLHSRRAAGSIIEYHYNIDLKTITFFDRTGSSAKNCHQESCFYAEALQLLPLERAVELARGLRSARPAQARPDGIVRMTSTNVPAFVEEDHMPPVNEVSFAWCLSTGTTF